MSQHNQTFDDPYDTLPAIVRTAMLDDPYAISFTALQFKLRVNTPEQVVAFIHAIRDQRIAAAYLERGFTIHPATGEPL